MLQCIFVWMGGILCWVEIFVYYCGGGLNGVVNYLMLLQFVGSVNEFNEFVFRGLLNIINMGEMMLIGFVMVNGVLEVDGNRNVKCYNVVKYGFCLLLGKLELV